MFAAIAVGPDLGRSQFLRMAGVTPKLRNVVEAAHAVSVITRAMTFSLFSELVFRALDGSSGFSSFRVHVPTRHSRFLQNKNLPSQFGTDKAPDFLQRISIELTFNVTEMCSFTILTMSSL